MAYQLSRLKRGDDAGAREALQRSLQSLARHKHVSVISRCVLVSSTLHRALLIFDVCLIFFLCPASMMMMMPRITE